MCVHVVAYIYIYIRTYTVFPISMYSVTIVWSITVLCELLLSEKISCMHVNLCTYVNLYATHVCAFCSILTRGMENQSLKRKMKELTMITFRRLE